MNNYIPTFKCPHCGNRIEAKLTTPTEGFVGMCNCVESWKAWEKNHREMMEAKKQAKKRVK